MAKPRNGWKTLRVVVEIPVQGDLTEKELAYVVDSALRDGGFDGRLRFQAPYPYSTVKRSIQWGTLHVKQFSRVKAALTRTILGRL